MIPPEDDNLGMSVGMGVPRTVMEEDYDVEVRVYVWVWVCACEYVYVWMDVWLWLSVCVCVVTPFTRPRPYKRCTNILYEHTVSE